MSRPKSLSCKKKRRRGRPRIHRDLQRIPRGVCLDRYELAALDARAEAESLDRQTSWRRHLLRGLRRQVADARRRAGVA